MIKRDSIEFQRLSAAIAWLRFPLILCVVMLHCYCTVPLPEGDHSLYLKIVYPFGLWLGESGVPAFFFISGFLFYVSQKNFKEKIHSRIYSLFFPYMLWNSIFLFLYLVLWFMGHPLDILGKNISNYGVIDYIRAYVDRGEYAGGNNGPILCTYWYVRNLFLLCLTSPLWYYLNRFLKFSFPLALLLWWMSQYHNALLAESILFFNLGACFAINDINPLGKVKKQKFLILSFWFVITSLDILSHGFFYLKGSFYVHRVSLVTNIFVFLLLSDVIVWKYKNKASLFLTNSVFWVYAIHDHLAIALRRLCMSYWGGVSDITHVFLYFMTVLLVTAICLVSYAIMYHLHPKFVCFATGNRRM